MYKNKINEYRLKKQMSMSQLAKKAKISTGYLCHLEKGTRQNPSTKVMQDIAKALEKTIAEVFFIEE